MAFCIHCGAEIQEGSKFCTSCGAPVEAPAQPVPYETPAQEEPPAYEPPAYTQPETPVQPAPNPYDSGSQGGSSYSSYTQPGGSQFDPFGAAQSVTPVPTGGLIAWSVITLLLCTIPGIVALVQTLGVNKAFTVEEQQKKLRSAKTWCIVGTILGILAAIGNYAANNM